MYGVPDATRSSPFHLKTSLRRMLGLKRIMGGSLLIQFDEIWRVNDRVKGRYD